MKKGTVIALAAAALTIGARAEAQVDANARGLRLTVDRMFGFQWSSIALHNGTRDSTVEQTVVNAFGSYLVPIAPSLTPVPFAPMRIGVDWELANHVTIGAAFALGWMSFSFGGITSSAFTLGFAPRVGYSLRIAPSVAFWPRAGLTLAYNAVNSSGGTSILTLSGNVVELSVNVDPTMVFAVTRQFAITTSLMADLPLVGTLSYDGSTRSQSFTKFSVGVQVGVQGRF